MAFGGAPEGNSFAQKLPTRELRKMAFDSYCEHIANGKSKRSWTMKSSIKVSWETMEKYIKEYSHEFDLDALKNATSIGFSKWEQVLDDSANGKNTKANFASLKMKFNHVFNWGKDDNRPEANNEAAAAAQDKLMNQLAVQQQAVQEEAANEK